VAADVLARLRANGEAHIAGYYLALRGLRDTLAAG